MEPAENTWRAEQLRMLEQQSNMNHQDVVTWKKYLQVTDKEKII